MAPCRYVGRLLLRLALTLGCLLPLGCSQVLNPALVNSLGINPTNTLPNPDGYVILMFTNLTAGSLSFSTTHEYNGEFSESFNYIVSPGTPFMVVEPCELTSFQLGNLTVAFPGGESIEVPSNRGAVIKNRDFTCGSVIAVTVQGAGAAVDLNLEVF